MIRAPSTWLLLVSGCAEATAPVAGGGPAQQVVPFAVPDVWCPTSSGSFGAPLPGGCMPPRSFVNRVGQALPDWLWVKL
jgi:hypothetical protein